MPTVRQLRYFVALEEVGHFGRAAGACHVSQAAFSVGIRELEQALGVTLVERTRRRVTVTPVGAEIATQAGCDCATSRRWWTLPVSAAGR